MNRTRSLFVAVGLAVAALVASGVANAATPNLPVGSAGVVVMPIHLSGATTASTDDVAVVKLPFPAYVLGVSATARASSGTDETLTIDVEDDGTSILSAPISVTASEVAEGSVTVNQIADESLVSIDLAIGGTDTPTFTDITILLTLQRN